MVHTPAGIQPDFDSAAAHSAEAVGQHIQRWTVPMVPGAARPLELQQAIDGMAYITDPRRVDFVDRLGRGVRVPRIQTADGMATDKSVVPFGVAEVLWDFLLGRIALGEYRPDRPPQLYVQDYDRAGSPLPGWHRIATLQSEYGIDRKDMLAGLDDIIIRMLETSDRPRVRRGIRFANVVFTRIDGRVTRLHRGDDTYYDPVEVTFIESFSEELADKAEALIAKMTDDSRSCENLLRWFATPLLEKHKELCYIVYGGGGNGKGTLLRGLESCPATRPLYEAVDMKLLLQRGGGFGQESAMLRIMGKLWMADEDCPELTVQDMDRLKKFSTNDTVTARSIGQNSITFHVDATPVLMTNETITIPSGRAGERRFVFVRTVDDRPQSELEELNHFVDRYACVPFMMASCRVWETRGDTPMKIRLGDASMLSPREQFIVDSITRLGYVLVSAIPHCSDPEYKNTMVKLGLRGKVKRVPDASGYTKPARVLEVKDESTFAPYRAAVHDAEREAEADDSRAQRIADGIYAALDDHTRPEGLTVADLARILYPDETVRERAENAVWEGLRVLGRQVVEHADPDTGTVRLTLA